MMEKIAEAEHPVVMRYLLLLFWSAALMAPTTAPAGPAMTPLLHSSTSLFSSWLSLMPCIRSVSALSCDELISAIIGIRMSAITKPSTGLSDLLP